MTNRERDLSVERWLRQTPVAGARSESPELLDDCLDAEMLAAWAEGRLDRPARSTVEGHAANCARCQAMLAVMARTIPAPPQSVGSPIRKWLMMLGPAVAAAAAVALWFAVDQRSASVVGRLGNEEAAAQRPPESPSPSTAPQPAVLEKEVERGALRDSLDRQAPKREGAASDALADARRENETRVGVDKRPTAAPGAARAADERNERKDVTARKDVSATNPSAASLDRLRAAAADSSAPPPPPPPAPASPPVQSAAGNQNAQASGPPPAVPLQQGQTQNQNQNQNQNQGSPRQQAAAPMAERVVVAERPAAGRGGAVGGLADATLGYRQRAAGAFDVVAADASARWRVVDGRTVERSLDAGVTWANQYSAEDGVTLIAGVAPSSSVCWLVGRPGVVVLTTDGRAWQRIKFPEPADLVAVTSPDARTATVTTADGRTFGTTDGGRNWTRR